MLQWHQKRIRCFVRFFTFLFNQYQKMNLLHTSNTKAMTWRIEKWICYTIKSTRFLCNRLFVVNDRFFVLKFAINQNASINKNSKNSNSRSLKQHTFAKSISFCCICFWLFWEIDRFIILICKYLSHQLDKILNKIFMFVIAYIYFRSSRTSFAFVFISSRLSHLLWVFQFQ